MISVRNTSYSDNWINFKDLDVFIHEKEMNMTPNKEVYDTDTITGRRVILGYEYTHREFLLKLIVKADNKSALREKLNKINDILDGEITLRFNDEPDLLYRRVHVSSTIDIEEINSSNVILTVNFIAYDPFIYSEEKHVSLYVTGEQTFTVENKGNQIYKPLILIRGLANKVTISNSRSGQISYVDLHPDQDVYLDNRNYEVFKIINGIRYNALDRWEDSFIEILPGINEITISGDAINIDFGMTYRDAYL